MAPLLVGVAANIRLMAARSAVRRTLLSACASGGSDDSSSGSDGGGTKSADNPFAVKEDAQGRVRRRPREGAREAPYTKKFPKVTVKAWNQGKAAFIPSGSWLENEQKTVAPKDFETTRDVHATAGRRQAPGRLRADRRWRELHRSGVGDEQGR